MAMGFVNPGGGGVFRWLGDQVKAKVDQMIEDRMYRSGAAIVARAQQLAPVKTGALRNSIGYVVTLGPGTKTLSIQVGVSYGLFQEFGTRNIPPHPFIRPALNEASRIWGADIQTMFASPAGHGPWAGLIATNQGFALSQHSRKPLTAKQAHHVKTKLVPMSRKLWRGNTKRARMHVKRRSG